MVLYAIHDALVKPMPAGPMTPCLAESWSMSPDGLTFDFVLRAAKFHNGEPVTAEDVKFSFERYRGGAATLLKSKVKEVKVVDARRVRFVLKEAWPDFMTFYGTTATGSGWVVPKKYVERVGDEGFKKARRGRPLQGRLVHARHRAGSGGLRRVLAQVPQRQACDPQEHPRRDDTSGRAQERRRGRGLHVQRPGGRAAPP